MKEEKERIRRKRLTLQEREGILEMYADPDTPLEAIMEKFNVTKPTISQLASENGMSRQRKWTKEEIALILRKDEIGIDNLCQQLNASAKNIIGIYHHYKNKQL